MTFFWADTHFFHANIIRFADRPDYNVEGMNERLIANWNAAVGPKDVIWFLGDFAFKAEAVGKERILELFFRLNGKKHLLIGNHDEKNPFILKLPWKRQEKLFTFRENKRRAELCHYPLETWKAQQRGALMLHGHSHGGLQRHVPGRYDVGCDVEEFPVSWEELCKRQ